ncbi:MAG: DNA replication and repair protein RecF [Chlamydiae bacterium]|nr:DNA replication and repair protein RecF [Chlamydiota bacterium]
MLKKLYLHHFRNYTQLTIPFSPGVNWITGRNGQGKTNLIDAISVLSTGRSFRTSQLSQLIQHGEAFFYLETTFEREEVSQILKVSFDGENKRVQHNATQYSHFSPLLGLIPFVLYAPEDIALVGGAPAIRRRFFNLHLAQVDPLYLHHLARYHKAMRQRNELLKKRSEEAIDPWEMAMAVSGHYLMEKRRQFISEMQKPFHEKGLALSEGADHFRIAYQSSLPFSSSDSLLDHLQKNRKKELHIGTTLAGPHRDDIRFSVGGQSAKAYASEGQKHSIIASLRLSEWEHLKGHTSLSPLLCIDDFGAHLDPFRQKRLEEMLGSVGQTFLTSPTVNSAIFPDKQVIEIEAGLVTKNA